MNYPWLPWVKQARRAKARSGGPKRRFRPWLEPLEDRTVPATLFWLGTLNANWNADNWTNASGAAVVAGLRPQDGDTLIFDTTEANFASRFATNNNLAAGLRVDIQVFDASSAGDFSFGGNAIQFDDVGLINTVDSNSQTTVGFASIGLSASAKISGNRIFGLNSPIALNGKTLTLQPGGPGDVMAVTSRISGDGDVVVSGQGFVFFTGTDNDNTYTGLTTITLGAQLQLGRTVAANAIVTSIPGDVLIENGGSLGWNPGASHQVADSADITNNGGGVFPFTAVETFASYTQDGAFSNFFAGNITVTGTTTIKDGRFQPRGDFGGPYTTNAFVMTGGDTFISFNNQMIVGAGGMELTGAVPTIEVGSTLRLRGDVTIHSSATQSMIEGHGGGGFGTVLLDPLAGNSITFDVADGAGDVDLQLFSTAITGSAGIVKKGAGTLQMTGVGTSSFTGTTSVLEGKLQLSKNDGLVAISGPLEITGGAVQIDTLGQIASTSAIKIDGATAVLDVRNLTNPTTPRFTVEHLFLRQGTIQDGDGNGIPSILSLVNPGATALFLTGGAVIPLDIKIDGNIEFNTARSGVAVLSGGSLQFEGFSELNVAFGDGDSHDLRIDSAISQVNPSVIFVNGGGRLNLTNGANDVGSVEVLGGSTLLLNNATGSATGAGSITVSDGDLGGNGATTASVFVDPNGKLTPGNSPGLLTTGDITFNGGQFLVELEGPTPGTQYDRLVVNGTVTLVNNPVLNVVSNFAVPPALGSVFVVLVNDSDDSILPGIFQFQPQDSIVTDDKGLDYRVTYLYDLATNTDGTGNDMALIREAPAGAPVATSNQYTVTETATLLGNVKNDDTGAGIDSDPDGDPLTVDTVPVVNVANGVLTLNGTGDFSYVPNPGFRGIDTFTYRITDGVSSATAVVTMTVLDDDLTPPTIAITGSLGDSTDDPAHVFNWSISDVSGISTLVVFIRQNGNTIFGSTSALAGSFDFDAFGPGVYTIEINATDADAEAVNDRLLATRTETANVTDDDSTGPTITLGTAAGQFDWDVTDPSGLGATLVTVTRDGAPIFQSNNATGLFDFSALGDGAYQINVTASDADLDQAADSATSLASRQVQVGALAAGGANSPADPESAQLLATTREPVDIAVAGIEIEEFVADISAAPGQTLQLTDLEFAAGDEVLEIRPVESEGGLLDTRVVEDVALPMAQAPQPPPLLQIVSSPFDSDENVALVDEIRRAHRLQDMAAAPGPDRVEGAAPIAADPPLGPRAIIAVFEAEGHHPGNIDLAAIHLAPQPREPSWPGWLATAAAGALVLAWYRLQPRISEKKALLPPDARL